jgi:hypothetical protein
MEQQAARQHSLALRASGELYFSALLRVTG